MANLTPQERELNGRVIAIYELLKDQRKVRNKSDFCNMLGLPSEYFSRFEKNKIVVPDKAIDEISVLFDIDEDWIVSGLGRSPFEQVLSTVNVSGNRIKGNRNTVGSNIQTLASDLQVENEKLKTQIDKLLLQIKYKDLAIQQLEDRIKDKEEMIELLKKK